MANWVNYSLTIFIILLFDSLSSLNVIEGDIIEPHVVEEEEPLEHYMSLGKVALDMTKMRHFLRNPPP